MGAAHDVHLDTVNHRAYLVFDTRVSVVSYNEGPFVGLNPRPRRGQAEKPWIRAGLPTAKGAYRVFDASGRFLGRVEAGGDPKGSLPGAGMLIFLPEAEASSLRQAP
jgi:hypothetical protein